MTAFNLDAELDGLTQPAPAPQATPPATPVNLPPTSKKPTFDLGAELDGLDAQRKEDDALSAQFLRYRQQNASIPGERQAEVFRTAAALRQMGETPELDYVEKNLDTLKKRTEAHGARWDEVLRDHPGLKDYLLEKPQRQDFITDDLKNATGLSYALSVPFAAAKHDVDMQGYYAKTLKAFATNSPDVPEEPTIDYGAKHWWSSAYAKTLNLIPMLSQYGAAGAVGFAGGAAAAAPVAGAAALATAEIAGVGGAAVELGAGAIGAKTATAALAYYQAVGPAYARLIKQGISPRTAGLAASAEATAAAAIFGVGMPGLLGKLGLPSTAVEELGVETAKALASKSIAKVAGHALTQFGENEAHAMLTMAAIGAASNVATQAARLADKGKTPSVKSLANDITSSMVSAATDFAVISAWAPAREAYGNIGESLRLGRDQEQLKAAFDGAEKSKLLDHSPDEFKAFIAKLGQGGLKKLYAPIGDYKAYWEARRADPREAAAQLVGDNGEAYDHAVQTGGDLAIPVDNYLTVLGKTEHARGLSQDLKIRPDGRTPRQEQARVEKRAEELAKIPVDDLKEQAAKELLTKSLEQTFARGFAGNKKIANPEKVAADSAKLHAAAFERMAQEINLNANEGTKPVTAWDVYRQHARLEVEGQKGVRAGDIAAEAYADPSVRTMLEQSYATLDAPAKTGEYFRDRNTQLLNERGAELRARDPSRPLTARFSIPSKAANDLHGHLSVDGALRVMARVMSGEIRDGVKRSGDIEGDFIDNAQVAKVSEAMSKALGVKVVATAVPRAESTPDTLAALGAEHEKTKAAAIAAGTFPDRGGLPVEYKDKPGDFAPVAARWAAESPAQAYADLTPTHEQALAGMTPDRAFFETYHDPSGLLNELGVHRMIELSQPAHVISSDGRAIGKMNAMMGRPKVNIVLDMLSEAFHRAGGGEFNLGRLHGDEYGGGGNDIGRMKDFFEKVRRETNAVVLYGRAEGGGYFLQEGIHFDYGIESTFDRADRIELARAKSERGEVAGPKHYDTAVALFEAIDGIRSARKAKGTPYEPRNLDLELGRQDQERVRGSDGGARSEDHAAPDGQGVGVHGAPDNGAERADLAGGVPQAPVGGPGTEAPGPVAGDGQPGVGAHPNAPGEVRLSEGVGSSKGRVLSPGDSTKNKVAHSKWDGYQRILETIGGVESGPSEQADGKYRAWKAREPAELSRTATKKDKREQEGRIAEWRASKPAAFPRGPFDTINDELRSEGKLGHKEGVTSAFEAFDLLTKNTSWTGMQRAVELLRTVPGLERVSLPERVEARLAIEKADKARDEHYGTRQPEAKLEQPGKRGSIGFELPRSDGAPRRYEMSLSGADESTVAHESMHMLAEVMHDIATGKDAPPKLKADYEALIKWMGHASPEARVEAAKERITLERKKDRTPEEERRLATLTAKEERAAVGWEEYLKEGKAPSAALHGVFSRFGGWLAKIYKASSPAAQFKAEFGEDLGLTPEVKAIFDRLLATEEQLDKTRASIEMQPLPIAHRGMTPKEQEEYAAATEEMHNDARNEVLRDLVADKRERSKLIEDERGALEADKNDELDHEPVYRALSFLQDREFVVVDDAGNVSRVDPPAWLVGEDGKTVRMDRKAIDKAYGKGAWKDLPSGSTVDKGGIAPGELADALGFDSGEALVRALQNVDPRRAVVQKAVQSELVDRYGPALLDDPETLFEDTVAATHNEAAAKRAILEIRSLRRQLDPDADPRMEATSDKARKATAKRLIAEKKIGDLSPEYYHRAEQSASKRALEAALGGNIDKAIGERETQLLNHYLYREARDAKATTDNIREQLEKKVRDTYRAALGKAVRTETLDDGTKVDHREYLDAHDAITSAIGIGTRTPEDFKLGDVLARMELEAADVVFDTAVIEDILKNPVPYNELTLPQALDVDAAIKNIRQASMAQLEIIVDGQRTTVKSLVDGIKDELEQLPFLGKEPNAKQQVSALRRTLLAVQGADGGLLDPGTLFEMMGPKAKAFFMGRYFEARTKRDALEDMVLGKIFEAWKEMPQEMRDRRHEVVAGLDEDLPVPDHLNLDGPRDRQWLWMAFLNMGNRGPKSNAERLTKPFGWTEEQVEKAIGKYLTPEETDFLQKVLTVSDKDLWPEIAAKEERKTGLAPEKIKASPITITFADGTTKTYEGGYFPARYRKDAAIGEIAAKQAEGAIQSFYSPNYERASTPKSHTKARAAGYSNVLDLDWSVVTNHLAQVVHDIAFDEYVRDTARVLMHPDLQNAIYQRMGAERSTQPRAWLKATANAFADSVPENMRWWQKIINPLRSRTVAAAIGNSLPVAAGDLTNPFVAMASGDIGKLSGTLAVGKAVTESYKMLRGTSEWRNRALELSPELKHRARHNERKIKQAIEAIGKKQGKFVAAADRAKVMLWAFQDATSAFAETTIWHAAHSDALGNGLTGADAVRYADSKVQDNLPSHDIAEQSALLRDKRGLGSLLIFHGYFNKLYNVERRLAHKAYISWHEDGLKDQVLRTAEMASRIAAVVAFSGAASEFLSGRGKSPDETTGQWFVRRMLEGQASTVPFGGFASPLIDRAVTGHSKPASVRAAPGLSLIENAAESIGKLASHERDNDKKVWDAIELVLMGIGGPARQARRTGEYLTHLVEGDAQDKSIPGIISGVIYGEREDQPANPVNIFSH